MGPRPTDNKLRAMRAVDIVETVLTALPGDLSRHCCKKERQFRYHGPLLDAISDSDAKWPRRRSLRGDRDRAKRHIQRVDKSARSVGELHLTGQLLAKRLHHSGAEASPGGRLDRRASPFRPDKAKPLLRLIHRPCDFHAARGDG